jgi:hypothetical protein
LNKEAIEARLAQLRADLANVQGTYAAIQGAIQDCEFWLKQLDSTEPDPPVALA